MKSRVYYLLAALIVISFASCKKSNTQGRYIPATAAFVLHIDGKSLSEKLPWSEIKNNPLFKDAYADSNKSASLKKIMDNPDNSGVDTKTDLMLFMQKDSSGGYIAFEGNIKDEAAFRAFTAEVTEKAAVTEKNGINFISKFPVCAGWNKEKFVYIIDAPQLAKMDALTRRMQNDSIDVDGGRPRDIIATCQNIFALSEGNSLAKEERFTTLVKETGDMHFWMNSEELYKGGEMPAALALLNLDKLYKGAATAATFSFENGKISLKSSSYTSDEMEKLVKKYGGGKIDETMLKKMPGKDVMAVAALHFNPEGLREFLKLLNLEGLINLGTSRLGFNLDDFIKANKGDIMFGMSDLKIETDTSNLLFKDEEEFAPAVPKPHFNFVFATSVGDKDAFNKLINSGKKMLGNANFTDGAPIAYSSNGTYFAISNTQANADGYTGGKGTDFDFISKISGEPMGGFFNLQLIIKAMGGLTVKDSSAAILYSEALKTWDNVLFKGGGFIDGATHFTAEINMMDKNTNSLKQLNQYLLKMSEVMQEKKRKQKEDMMAFEDAISPSVLKDSASSSAKGQ